MRAAAALLVLMLAGCVPYGLVPGMPPPNGAAMVAPQPETSKQKLALAEQRFQAVMRSLDRMEKRGMIRDTTQRKTLAALIEAADFAIQEAHDAIIIGGASSTAAAIAADEAVSDLVIWYTSKKGKL